MNEMRTKAEGKIQSKLQTDTEVDTSQLAPPTPLEKQPAKKQGQANLTSAPAKEQASQLLEQPNPLKPAKKAPKKKLIIMEDEPPAPEGDY